MTISHGPDSTHLFLYPPAKPTEYNKVWVNEPEEFSGQDSLPSLAMIVIKQHGEDLEDELVNEVAHLAISSSEDVIEDVKKFLGQPIDISGMEQNYVTMGIPCPLANMIPRTSYLFDDIMRFHQLIPHSCPLNTLL